MRRGLCRYLAFAALIVAGQGCTTPHHSNALIFGTNTVVGLSVGPDVTAAASINVGYRRQEAVFMPLVATNNFAADGTPTPCAVGPDLGATVATGERAVPACFLVGQHGGAIDAYSVLASFGAEFSARATDPSAGGGLAQFFATGIAAQALAIRGGPALVAVGAAASAQNGTTVGPALEALLDNPSVATRAAVIRSEVVRARAAARAYLDSLADEANFAARVELFASVLNEAGLCTGLTRQDCLARIDRDSVITAQPAAALNAAVAAAQQGN